MTVSAVIVTYRRLDHLDQVLKGWLRETPDVWLCDCSQNGYKCTLPVNIIRANPDPGNKIRHAVALLTSGDLVIKADDDLVPLPGLAAAFINAQATLPGPAILGIHGRRFLGPHYYGQTKMVGQGKYDMPQPVDFVGVITGAPRALLAMDLRGCANEVEDLFWQMVWYPNVKKWVIPTKGLVQHLPESFDKDRLCGGRQSREIRQRFYAEWYGRNYANRGRS